VSFFSALDQKVFLDLKLHDIPNTVASAVVEIAGLGAQIINVHATGGKAMIAAAVQSSRDWAQRYDRRRPQVIAVTLLTSLTDRELNDELLVSSHQGDYVLHLAKLAKEAGADGVVASPLEAGLIRQALGPDFLIVTPGIRLAGDALADQRRVDTPGAAIRSGSNLLVVGRSITESSDPAGAARRILEEVESAGP